MTAAPGSRGDAAALELDLKGLKCPLPALHTRKALRALPPGARLVVACTDPLAVTDVPHAAHESGAICEGRSVADGVLTFTLRKSG